MNQANGRKAIFITGAASGMGLETARLFASEGWFVGGVDVNDEGLASLKAELGDAGFVTRLDVTDREAYRKVLADFAEATGGKLDILFNNAGIGRGGPFQDMPWEDALAVVNINLIAVLSGIHLAIPLLKATPNSLCFSTSSSSAIFGIANIAVYSATKHAVKGFTEALSVELKAAGVRVADTLPGLIDTPILPPEAKTSAPTEGMWRLIPPVEVAKAVWGAYHNDKIHWYVPVELEAYDLIVTQHPEQVRDQMVQAGLFNRTEE
ncbi:SDR family oxidoreductase [Caulobacter mirabilis]|uniref:Short-chain dehydrogenase n=1 Tax=Caulobacter mirabilis TaxID=69666 RepID=A0A2D2B273_9CAUL|nr:SDR family oxidoreductase [Caulobacter mirabilis]ATQ44365.1 short-chain dehydrogenase [Caulobacter mirabilis]